MATSPKPSTEPENPTQRKFEWKQVVQGRPVRILASFLLLPLLGTLISGMIIGRIVDRIIGIKTYCVYIVGNQHENSVGTLMEAASEANGRYASLPGNVTVKTELIDDYGDPQQAEAISRELATRPDTLMIVGHGYSTTSKQALPNYLGADPPIPVILTTETNPNLVPSSPPSAGNVSVAPVFRLFPTDDNQAAIAAKFLAYEHAASVWVVQDTSNPTYSEYLARQFLKDANEEQPQLKVILWSNNLNLPPYSVDKLPIDWVFFAGEWMNALVLVRQMNNLPGNNIPGKKRPKILLSDWSADNNLTKFGQGDVEGVYLLHPLPAAVFQDNNHGGYEPVGREASRLTSALVAEVHEDFDSLARDGAPLSFRLRKWLGVHRVSDARRAMARYMSTAAMTERALTPGTSENPPIIMKWDRSTGTVDRECAEFHIWRIENGRFVDVQWGQSTQAKPCPGR
jgi:hypothetical protein